MTERPLTAAERALAQGMFGTAIDLDPVRIRRRKWWPLQPRGTVMAPRGHLYFHPDSPCYCPCFGADGAAGQGLFLHELTHVWQHQSGLNLLLRRHPFCRYDYAFRPGRPFARYGIEQQAEIVRHVFLMRRGYALPGKPPLAALEAILPFPPPATRA
ncbi:MAG TPA: vgr related protein [Sphingobium sp.]|nr:vgr related protein [Sphingobium sp.]